jgi:hypothetical protein
MLMQFLFANKETRTFFICIKARDNEIFGMYLIHCNSLFVFNFFFKAKILKLILKFLFQNKNGCSQL